MGEIPGERMMQAWRQRLGPGPQFQGMSASAAEEGTAGACTASGPAHAI